MKRLQINRNYLIIGGLFFLLALCGVFFDVGRTTLFETSTLIDLGLEPAKKPYRQKVLLLSNDTGIEQTFLSEYPGLYQVSVFLVNQGELADEVKIQFYLRETCASKNNIRKVVVKISPDDMGENTFYPFTFEPIDDSAGQNYCFLLELVSGDNIGIWASHSDVYIDGQAVYQTPSPVPSPDYHVQEKKIDGPYKVFLPIVLIQPDNKNFDVGFQLHYNGYVGETFEIFVQRLVEYKPYLWGNIRYYVILLIVYLGGIILLLRIKPD